MRRKGAIKYDRILTFLVGVVIYLTIFIACTDDTTFQSPEEVESVYQKKGTSALTLVIGQPNGTNRMGDDYTQQNISNDTTVELNSIKIIAVKNNLRSSPDSLADATFRYLQEINLSQRTAYSGVNKYYNLTIPYEDYQTIRYLFYGVNDACVTAINDYAATGVINMPDDYSTLIGDTLNHDDALFNLVEIPSPIYDNSSSASKLSGKLQAVVDSVDAAIKLIADDFSTVSTIISDSLRHIANEYLNMMNIRSSRETLQFIQLAIDSLLLDSVPLNQISSDSSVLRNALLQTNHMLGSQFNLLNFYVYDPLRNPKYDAKDSGTFPAFPLSNIQTLRDYNVPPSVYAGLFTQWLARYDEYIRLMNIYTNNYTPLPSYVTLVDSANVLRFDADDRFTGKSLSQLTASYNEFTQQYTEADQESEKSFCESLLDDYYDIISASTYGSNYGIEIFLSNVYNSFAVLSSSTYHGQYISAVNKIEEAIEAIGTIGSGTNNLSGISEYYVLLDAEYDNIREDTPYGAFCLQFDSTNVITYKDYNISKWNDLTVTIAFDEHRGFGIPVYCYPPSLTYFGNGYLTGCDSVIENVSSIDWTSPSYDDVYSGGDNGIANPIYYPNLAFSHTIQYGVGMLDLKIKTAAGGIKFSTITDATQVDIDGEYDQATYGVVTTDDIYLSGIIVGGQPQTSGFDFQPHGTNKVAVYDRHFPNAPGNSLGSEVFNSYISGVSKSYSDVIQLSSSEIDLYTLLMPTAINGYPQGSSDSIIVALELVNGCDQFLIGSNGLPIYPGSVFYISGLIDKYDVLQTFTYERIINSDVTTPVSVTLDDFSYKSGSWNKELYPTVPYMQKSMSSFTMYITEGWIDGVYGEKIIGK